MNLGTNEIKGIYVGSTPAAQIYVGTTKVWPEAEPEPVAGPWLCFTAEEANSTVHLDKVGSPSAISLETSTDGSTWTDYSWTDSTGNTLTLANVSDKVYMRAKTFNYSIGNSDSHYYKFVMTGRIAASGNIQTLLKVDGSRTTAEAYCYNSMFSGCTSLTTAPTLPATTLARACYKAMFSGCTSLTTAPTLPATSLGPSCYLSMFSGCTSLTTAPALPATSLAEYCYQYMFRDCSSLTTAPALPATTLANWCYNSMFSGCTQLSSVKVALTAWGTMYMTKNWLYRVAATGTFTCPAELPDTRGVNNIPEGWTKVDAT